MAFIAGTIRYETLEGYIIFPANARTRFRSMPEKDSTGRTIKWTTCTLTVEAYISSDNIHSTVDSRFDQVRKILESPAGKLSIDNKGMGPISVNENTATIGDVDWGPFPKVVEWEPLGNVSCYVSWEVEFKYLNSRYTNAAGIAEFAWSSRFDLDEDGGTVRTISGHLLVTGRRINYNSKLADKNSNADAYRELITVECPIGFVRDRQTFDVNEAKTRIDFTFVDRQLHHEAFPVGIADMDTAWDLDTATDRGIFTRFIYSFTGNAKAALNYPKSIALRALREEHDFRFIQLLRQLKSSYGSIIPLPARFRVYEKTKGADVRRVHLSISWVLTVLPTNAGSYFPRDILQRCGFFKQKANNALLWKAGMLQDGGPLTVRGHAKLEVPNHDLIADLRKSSGPPIPTIGTGQYSLSRFYEATDEMPFVPISGSYHDYRNDLEAVTVVGKIVPIPIDASLSVKANTEVKLDADRPRFKMYGQSVRYNQKPEIPELTKVNRSKVVRFGIPIIKHYDIKSVNGVALYGATWEIWYIPLENDKAGKKAWIENPANPAPGGGTSQPNITVPPVVVGTDS